MAILYLRSTDGDDADDGSTWALAKATLAGAFAAASAGDTIYVSDNHAETQASLMTLNPPGTEAAPTRVICVDDTGDPEPPTALATTATVTTTGINNIVNNAGAFLYVRGVSFISGNDIDWLNTTGVGRLEFEQCGMQLTGTATSDRIDLGNGNTQAEHIITFHDCDFVFGSTFQGFIWRAAVRIIGGSISATGSVLTTIVRGHNRNGILFSLENVDLSNLVTELNSNAQPLPSLFLVRNCQLGASVALGTGALTNGAEQLLLNSDSADTNYRLERRTLQGTETSETTVVLDASDGTTTYSRKLVSSADAEDVFPMVSARIVGPYNTTVGSSQTATIEIVTDNVTLTDAECWIRLTYMGTSGRPLALAVDDRDADWPLGTPANQTTSSAAWTTTGLGTPVKQALSVSFQAEEEGYLVAEVMLAKASTTVYVNPKIDLT